MREYSSKEQKKFKQFRTIIFKELKENGRTIAELQKKFPKKSFDHDPEMKNTLFKKRWCQLQSIEKVICEKLEINYDDYGKRRSHNRIRSRIANEITEIRRVGKIIDLKFGSKLGVWRKTDPMEEKAIVEFKNKNYSFSSDEQSYKKIKEKQFKNFVQDQYKKCLLCRNSKNLGKSVV